MVGSFIQWTNITLFKPAPVFSLSDFLITRFPSLLFRFIATPLAGYLGVTEEPIVFVENTFCEKVYQTISKCPNAERVEGLSKQLGWTPREVKRWFKNRRQQSKPSIMRKATESRCVIFWSLSFYFLVVPWVWELLFWTKINFKSKNSWLRQDLKLWSLWICRM